MKRHSNYSSGHLVLNGGRARHTHGQRASVSTPVVLLAVAMLAIAGCSSVPQEEELLASSAVMPAAAQGVTADGRTRFREIFCLLAEDQGVSLARRGDACEKLLWRLKDESFTETAEALPPLNKALQVFVVGGSFSDCFGAASSAFPHAIERLADEGYPVSTVGINSRSSADYNARMIAKELASAADGPIVLVGYSKGAVDIAHFLVAYPEMATRVSAVISIAGPIMGSEIAQLGDWPYETLFRGAFADSCDPGDGGVLDSLQPQFRRDWLASHSLPSSVRIYTLLGFTNREHIAQALIPAWKTLASSDPRNDGQLTISDGTWPGSTLLGYANADHWGLATEIEKELNLLARRSNDTPYPRGTLFEAALRYVSEDLQYTLVSPAAGDGSL